MRYSLKESTVYMLFAALAAIWICLLSGCEPQQKLQDTAAFQELTEKLDRIEKRPAPNIASLEYKIGELQEAMKKIPPLQKALLGFTGAKAFGSPFPGTCPPCERLARDIKRAADAGWCRIGDDDTADWQLIAAKAGELVPYVEFYRDGTKVNVIEGYPDRPTTVGKVTFEGPFDRLLEQHPKTRWEGGKRRLSLDLPDIPDWLKSKPDWRVPRGLSQEMFGPKLCSWKPSRPVVYMYLQCCSPACDRLRADLQALSEHFDFIDISDQLPLEGPAPQFPILKWQGVQREEIREATAGLRSSCRPSSPRTATPHWPGSGPTACLTERLHPPVLGPSRPGVFGHPNGNSRETHLIFFPEPRHATT